jgi:hypothetical protein
VSRRACLCWPGSVGAMAQLRVCSCVGGGTGRRTGHGDVGVLTVEGALRGCRSRRIRETAAVPRAECARLRGRVERVVPPGRPLVSMRGPRRRLGPQCSAPVGDNSGTSTPATVRPGLQRPGRHHKRSADHQPKPDQIEQAIVSDVYAYMRDGGAVPCAGTPAFTGPLDRSVRIDGHDIGYRVIQRPDGAYPLSTYWLTP